MSVELKGIELIGDEIGRIVCGMRGSVVVVRGCGVEMGRGKEAGVFELGGCRGVFWNITLRGVGRGGNVCGRLFGGEGRMGQKMSEREGGGGRGIGGWGRGSGRGEGGERGGQGGGGGRRGGEGREEGREEESEGGGSVLVCESDFSSFCVSSAPFLAPPLTRLVSLTQLTFFNISTNPSKTTHLGEGLGQRAFLMSGCSFSSVWDVYDGGIVPSLNSPSSSLDASNTSFVGCYRSQNVAVSGSEGNPSKPARQQIADNGANSFTWCVWNGSNTTGSGTSYSDGTSNGGAIYMYSKTSGTLSVKFCLFNDCYAHYGGGGIMCREISSIKIENNSFNACTAKNNYGGGMYAYYITSCNASTPYGHDVFFYDGNNLFSSDNPFYESYTTNSNDTRVCRYYYSGGWYYQHTEKKGWLKEGMKDRYVGVSGDDSSNLCGMSEAAPCKTVGHAAGSSMAQLSSTITLLGGRHVSEEKTISVGEKKISVLGKGKTVSVMTLNDDGNEGEKRLKHFRRNEGFEGEEFSPFTKFSATFHRIPHKAKEKDNPAAENISSPNTFRLRLHKPWRSAAR
ncbi:uncharacterized protein MONOS_16511 [Monocercomonoides exilis]|uniref:uncharacterized protein n=1 Tax=Monocercomonoides exilis TaxID=2049356 RepID=UPI0035597976|nr:hypothetical protein MONOS_16511 [Monocercomonoides exilis]|eukprot:MONOS_16511.1-p1 / transcript=MONOS_16511.1 / gene=MONOS_16511 / organism=Monocercomonoides_exilis_PA203 / gene_product=unspecified product / transcript_product=unspecified product / location=Mono_scaffold01803:1222-3369(+) / protein_length=567 / sequence_SO=supercontig / SO=protein_coding / is_pseudo=false